MPTWTFFGRVLPERVPVTLPLPLVGSGTAPILSVKFDFRVKIHASQAIVDLTLELDKPDIPTLRNLAAQQIRTIIDLIGYLKGMYFDVEIVSAICRETGDWTVFGIEIPVLAERRKAVRDEIQSSLLVAVSAKPSAQMVLADFREAMREAVGTGFYCYRAIEAMMQSMKVETIASDNSAWEQLRSRLRIDRSAIDEVKNHADFPRHGKPSGMTDAERAKVFSITDEIIRRFLEHLVCGKPLDDPEFPLIKSQV